MKKIICCFVAMFFSLQIFSPYARCMENSKEKLRDIKPSEYTYSGHIQELGDVPYVNGGEILGTNGRSLRLEGITIKSDFSSSEIPNGSIRYCTHIQDIGWTSFVDSGTYSGTRSQNKRIEAIKIELTGDIAKNYNVFYRTHVQNFGWLDWAKNGEAAGSAGYSYRMEAIQIRIISKDSKDISGNHCFEKALRDIKPSEYTYSGHIQELGDVSNVNGGEILGTNGRSLRLEGITIKSDFSSSEIPNGSMRYCTHVQDIGWMPFVNSGTYSGTRSQSKRIEAIKIELTGDIAKNYNVFYRTHVQNLGWLGWAKNGQAAGSAGLSYRMEAIQIQILSKRSGDIHSDSKSFIDQIEHKGIDVSEYQGVIDWDAVRNFGIDVAMLRTGFGKDEWGTRNQRDYKFERNYNEAKRAGIKVGAYHYSYAKNVQEALQEAGLCLKILNGRQLDYPVAFDFEDPSVIGLDKRVGTDICKTFCDEIRRNGYLPMIYMCKYWSDNKVIFDELKDYGFWLAQWGVSSPSKPCNMWQYTSKGRVPGINGDVDMDKIFN